MNAAVEVSQVTKRFGTQTALNNVSFSVPTGTVFALLGENGAGKTTTIKLLLGLEEADCGLLQVMGLNCRTHAAEIRRRVGHVPERPAVYEWMTASEIGWFTAGFYPEPYEQEYRKLLERFHVPIERKISQMSKGMRAKVSLSLALAHQPELLILDEPTSGLDTLVRREFLESMVDIAAVGRTVLLSSHQISEVERVADIVAIMREGELLVVESLDTLKCQIHELTVTTTGNAPPKLAGETLSCRRRGRQWQILIRGNENAEFGERRDQSEVIAVETRTPSLEEIFVAYMQSEETASELPRAGESLLTGNLTENQASAMSTIAISDNAPNTDKKLLVRFAWKEYRMLRGFWLALFALGVCEQWISTLMMSGDDYRYVASWLFMSAWGAAALYAVGAAVTLFGAENEDRTREFLRLLPGRWQPMFLAKVGVAIIGVVALALVLCLTGWILGGGEWPSATECRLTLGVAGVACVEAAVWGLLFSLLWKQPLMAAVAAMAAASFGSQLAVLGTPLARDSFSAESYQAAVPMRLLICLAVFAVDVLVVRRWLEPLGTKRNKRNKPAADALPAKPVSVVQVRQATSVPRRSMFARLLWQTVREAWRSILAAIGLGMLLIVAILVTFYGSISALALVWLIVPALLGALAFRADQKQDHRAYLAMHAARPTLVWLSRHFVWLGSTLLISGVILLPWPTLSDRVLSDAISQYVQDGYGRWGNMSFAWVELAPDGVASNQLVAWRYGQLVASATRVTVLGWCGVFGAYAWGQFFSQTFKREILAGFLAVLFSILLAAWSIAVFAWQLSALWFVLPFGFAALAATWLRTSNWLVGRQSVRGWIGPVLVLMMPFAVIFYQLPAARLAPFREEQKTIAELSAVSFKKTLHSFEEQLRNYQQSLDRIQQLGLLPSPDISEVTVDGKTLEAYGLAKGVNDAFQRGDRDVLNPEQRQLFDKFSQERQRLHLERNRAFVPQLLQVVRRSDFALPYYGWNWGDFHWPHDYFFLCRLLADDAQHHEEAGDLDVAWERLLALVQLDPTRAHINFNYEQSILRWAQNSRQTSKQVKSAIADLKECFAELPHPRQAILYSSQHVLDVVLEREPPSTLEGDHVRASAYFAYLANKLPWERQRAQLALAYLTSQAISYLDIAVTTSHVGNDAAPKYVSDEKRRELVQLAPWSMRFAIYVNESTLRNWQGRRAFIEACRLTDASNTSFLVAAELDRHANFNYLLQDWFDAETRRRALLVELALLAYRLDKGEYPASLDELHPDYLADAVIDPYSGAPFEYAPEGLELPLKYREYPGVAHEVPAGTPLLWSVGSADSQLEEFFEYNPENDVETRFGMGEFAGEFGGEKPMHEQDSGPPDLGHSIYRFRVTEARGYYRENLVFPLPQ